MPGVVPSVLLVLPSIIDGTLADGATWDVAGNSFAGKDVPTLVPINSALFSRPINVGLANGKENRSFCVSPLPADFIWDAKDSRFRDARHMPGKAYGWLITSLPVTVTGDVVAANENLKGTFSDGKTIFQTFILPSAPFPRFDFAPVPAPAPAPAVKKPAAKKPAAKK